MSEICAKTNRGTYPVIIKPGLLSVIGETCRSHVTGQRAFVVTDEHVADLYLATVAKQLRSSGFEVTTLSLPPGETSKNQKMLFYLYEQFHAAHVSRTDLIVALGGGVVGDLTGFAASSYLRGCPLIHVPTTLLAQVDAAIGGKTGIDMPFGKNLVGAFYQPRAVLIDPQVLNTLSKEVFADGMAEVIKYGCIRDKELFEKLEGDQLDLAWAVKRCVCIKTKIVERDEHDTGERMQLNFGHTLGHAIEKVKGYGSITHGQAIAAGMVFAASLGEHIGVTPSSTTERIIRVLQAYYLPTSTDASSSDLLLTMLSDKKMLDGKIHFVLLDAIGQARCYPLDKKELEGHVKILLG